MEQNSIFAATLGLCHPWKIASISFSRDDNRLDIAVDFDRGSTCPTCKKESATCTAKTETWHHLNFLNYATYLHARIPDIECPECDIPAVERPWSREGSKFVLVG
jgi:transposase